MEPMKPSVCLTGTQMRVGQMRVGVVLEDASRQVHVGQVVMNLRIGRFWFFVQLLGLVTIAGVD